MSTATSAAGDAFRESVRSWVEANFPPELKDQPASMEGAGDGDLAQALEQALGLSLLGSGKMSVLFNFLSGW